jgi:hypothetical protein
MTGRHRLTVHADLLPQAARDARLRVRELDPLGPNPALLTDDAPLYSKSVNSPLFWQGLVIQLSVVSLFDSHIFFGA